MANIHEINKAQISNTDVGGKNTHHFHNRGNKLEITAPAISHLNRDMRLQQHQQLEKGGGQGKEMGGGVEKRREERKKKKRRRSKGKGKKTRS